MTPQERQLMAELFDRLATLENTPRDPDAEAMIREGFRRAPNAAYALVQTVLVQDEALKAANNHIQQYEQAQARAATGAAARLSRLDARQPVRPRGAARLGTARAASWRRAVRRPDGRASGLWRRPVGAGATGLSARWYQQAPRCSSRLRNRAAAARSSAPRQPPRPA